MLVDPPIEHYEAPEHWVKLSDAIAEIPDLLRVFDDVLTSQIKLRLGDEIDVHRSVGPEWRIQLSGRSMRIGSSLRLLQPPPPPGTPREEELSRIREELGRAISVGAALALSRLATLVLDDTFSVHARFPTADSNFRRVPRDVWANAEADWRRNAAATASGIALHRVHIDPRFGGADDSEVERQAVGSPEQQLKKWFSAQVAASPYRKTIKISEESGSLLYEMASEFGVAGRDVAAVKRDVFSQFPSEVVSAWQKPGSPAGRLKNRSRKN